MLVFQQASKAMTDWKLILTKCGVRTATAEEWAPYFDEAIGPDTFSAGPDEVDDFLGQVLHESGHLERLEENLNYSAKRMVEVWPQRFKTLEDAEPFAHNPQALANKVYGGRMGNVRPNDGWAYRGSGPIQVTGYDNFAALERLTGLPLTADPGLLRRPGIEALRVCIAWWEGNVPDGILGDIAHVTKRVNGGTAGLAQRKDLTEDAREALG